MVPCRSMASILPSGETETAIEVPSWTVMLIVLGGCTAGAWAAPGNETASALRPNATGKMRMRRMKSPGMNLFSVIAGRQKTEKTQDLDKALGDLDKACGAFWAWRVRKFSPSHGVPIWDFQA